MIQKIVFSLLLISGIRCFAAEASPPPQVMPSWYDAPAKQAITDFVRRVVNPDSPEFVAPVDRVAVFDADGTLWSEQPASFQLLFAADRVRALAATHPEWKEAQPFRAVLEGDLAAVTKAGEQGLLDLLLTAHAGMTTDEYERLVVDWITSAKHPTTGTPYTELVYQPMLELLEHLRANGFRIFVSSSGTVEFMRPWVARVFGVPPENVIGSNVEVVLETRGGAPVLLREARIDLVNDKAGKVLAVHRALGRRPLLVFANADADLPLLRWTTAGPGPHLALLLRHTDPAREWEYDRKSDVGRLDQAIEEAVREEWTTVEMKRDWRLVRPRSVPAPTLLPAPSRAHAEKKP